jgi:hypothetical protein
MGRRSKPSLKRKVSRISSDAPLGLPRLALPAAALSGSQLLR